MTSPIRCDHVWWEVKEQLQEDDILLEVDLKREEEEKASTKITRFWVKEEVGEGANWRLGLENQISICIIDDDNHWIFDNIF